MCATIFELSIVYGDDIWKNNLNHFSDKDEVRSLSSFDGSEGEVQQHHSAPLDFQEVRTELSTALECRLLYEPAPGIRLNLDFLSFAKFYAYSDFTSIILQL